MRYLFSIAAALMLLLPLSPPAAGQGLDNGTVGATQVSEVDQSVLIASWVSPDASMVLILEANAGTDHDVAGSVAFKSIGVPDVKYSYPSGSATVTLNWWRKKGESDDDFKKRMKADKELTQEIFPPNPSPHF